MRGIREDGCLRSITPVAREARYGRAAIVFHWLIAALILVNWLLPQLAAFVARTDAPRLIALHRSIGVTVLALVLLRAAWRWVSPPPPLPGGILPLVRIAAHLGHAALYLLMVAVPVLGILFTWAGGRTLSVWGLVELPPPAWIDPDLHDRFRALHELTADAILWLIGLHVLAVLVHQYLFRDRLLDRMLPARLRPGRPRSGKPS
jgi:cytochrome b561